MFGFEIGDITAFIQIIWLDVVLSGDNALIIGMAASSLSPELRRKAIIFGMAAAAIIRIVFAILTTYLLAIPGILFFGGLLLLWVCWRFYRDLKRGESAEAEHAVEAKGYQGSPRRQLIGALTTITIADISMSIDNVLAVAAIARENMFLLVFGLALSIALMAFFATMMMRLLVRYPWISYVGLAFLLYVSGSMLYDGWPQVADMLLAELASGFDPSGFTFVDEGIQPLAESLADGIADDHLGRHGISFAHAKL